MSIWQPTLAVTQDTAEEVRRVLGALPAAELPYGVAVDKSDPAQKAKWLAWRAQRITSTVMRKACTESLAAAFQALIGDEEPPDDMCLLEIGAAAESIILRHGLEKLRQLTGQDWLRRTGEIAVDGADQEGATIDETWTNLRVDVVNEAKLRGDFLYHYYENGAAQNSEGCQLRHHMRVTGAHAGILVVRCAYETHLRLYLSAEACRAAGLPDGDAMECERIMQANADALREAFIAEDPYAVLIRYWATSPSPADDLKYAPTGGPLEVELDDDVDVMLERAAQLSAYAADLREKAEAAESDAMRGHMQALERIGSTPERGIVTTPGGKWRMKLPTRKGQTRVDAKRLREELPDVAAEYSKTGADTRGRLTWERIQ